jgi:hypothetical protein
MDEPRPFPPPRAHAFPLLPYALAGVLGLALLAGGLALALWRPFDATDAVAVHAIRITARPGIDLSKLEEVLDVPDYYLEVHTASGSVRTEVFRNTRVGSGLTFPLPVPIRMGDLTEVRLFDQNIWRDRLVDRVDHLQQETAGERFNFALLADEPPPARDRTLGWILAGLGGAVVLTVLIRFIRWQAI